MQIAGTIELSLLMYDETPLHTILIYSFLNRSAISLIAAALSLFT
jgi:hypothetical protein